MKVTFNLSFLLCISSVVMPVVDSLTNGFGLHKRSANLKSLATKRSTKHDVKGYDFAAHQQRRSLQTDDDDDSCETSLEELGQALGITIPCTCDDQGDIDETTECADFFDGLGGLVDDDVVGGLFDDDDDNCVCDTIQGERTCIEIDEEESNAASSGDDFAFCYTYTTGVFDNTICEIGHLSDGTCTITIDGAACSCYNKHDVKEVSADSS
jgi:hypothetical protein